MLLEDRSYRMPELIDLVRAGRSYEATRISLIDFEQRDVIRALPRGEHRRPGVRVSLPPIEALSAVIATRLRQLRVPFSALRVLAQRLRSEADLAGAMRTAAKVTLMDWAAGGWDVMIDDPAEPEALVAAMQQGGVAKFYRLTELLGLDE